MEGKKEKKTSDQIDAPRGSQAEQQLLPIFLSHVGVGSQGGAKVGL